MRATIEPLSLSYEVIYVDDCSPDGAWETLESLAAVDGHVRAFQLSRNFGQDAAITAGLSQSRARWTVVIDCDGQEPPEAIPALLAKAREGYDVVRTVRQARRHPRLRHAASRLYRRSLLESSRESEYSNMSLLTRRVVKALLEIRDRSREYTLMVDWLGFPQAIVSIEFAQRLEGRSSYTLTTLIRVALNGIFFRTTVLLRAVVFLGVAVALAGGGLAAYEIYNYFASIQPPGYTTVIVVLLLAAGLIIISIGVVGLYVGQVFEQVTARPLFIIRRQTALGGADPAAPPAEETVRVPAGGPRTAVPGSVPQEHGPRMSPEWTQ